MLVLENERAFGDAQLGVKRVIRTGNLNLLSARVVVHGFEEEGELLIDRQIVGRKMNWGSFRLIDALAE